MMTVGTRMAAATIATEVKLGGNGRSFRYQAHASGTASFMISDGWNRMKPRSSQRCAPIAISPVSMTTSSRIRPSR